MSMYDRFDAGNPYNIVPDAPSQLKGDDYLNLLAARHPELATTVGGVVQYKINPQSLSIKGGHRERVLGAARRVDDQYDQALYPARAAMLKEFLAGGTSSPSAQIVAGNTAVQHLWDGAEAAERLKKMPVLLQKIANSGLPFVSYASAVLNNASLRGTPEGQALAEAMTALNRFSEEGTKFYSGSAGSEAEKARALANLDLAKSLPELRGAFHQEAHLMSGKVNALQNKYQTGLSPRAWTAAIGDIPAAAVNGKALPFPILQQNTMDIVKKLEERARQDRAQQQQSPAAPNALPPPDAEGWITLPNGARLREIKQP